MKRILVIDDDDAIRRWLTEYLVDLGYETQVAVDGDHAIRSAVALRPDLILLDVRVPRPASAPRFAERDRERGPADRRAPSNAMGARHGPGGGGPAAGREGGAPQAVGAERAGEDPRQVPGGSRPGAGARDGGAGARAGDHTATGDRPGLVLPPQVVEHLGHDPAVDLVVARDLLHELDPADVRAILRRQLGRGPGAGHRAGPLGEALAPLVLYESVRLHRARDGLQPEAARAADDDRGRMHDPLEQVIPRERGPAALGVPG